MPESTPESKPAPKEEGHNPLLELTKARLREFFREPGTVFWVFGFPLLMALGLGLAFRSKPPEQPVVAVVVQENAPTPGQLTPRQLASVLVESKAIRAQVTSKEEALDALTHARVDVIVELSNQGANYRFDPTQDKSPVAKMVVDGVLQRASGRSDPLATREQTISEPGTRYIDFLVPGLIGMNLMGSSMWGVGYSLVMARKRKLLRRYAVTPMSRTDFLLSFLVSRALFVALELGLLVLFGWLVFGARCQGSLATFTFLGFLGAAAFAGISLLIGARIENTESANGWMNLIQLPMWVLSGAFFSYERFPEFLHLPIELLPLTALVNALRAVFNDAATLSSLGFPLAVMTVWGGSGFLLALKWFKWQ